jgi:hypothetical protein
MRYGYRRVHIVLRRGGPKIGLTAEAGKLYLPANPKIGLTAVTAGIPVSQSTKRWVAHRHRAIARPNYTSTEASVVFDLPQVIPRNFAKMSFAEPNFAVEGSPLHLTDGIYIPH